MRIWDYRLIPYLPDLQFKGQLRELVLIMHDWRDKGHTNHLLINIATEFPKAHLCWYFKLYCAEYEKRYNKKVSKKYIEEFEEFNEPTTLIIPLYSWWHNKTYLRVCMSNLFEKHYYGVGKSRITEGEWQRLLEGYKQITGEEYEI